MGTRIDPNKIIDGYPAAVFVADLLDELRSYVPEYFAEKWGHDLDIAKAKEWLGTAVVAGRTVEVVEDPRAAKFGRKD